jgi:putative membrane protein
VSQDLRPETVGDEERPTWELSAQWRRFLRRVRWGTRLVLIGGLIVLAAEIASVYRLFHDLHPMAGWLAATLFVAALAWFVGRPVLAAVRVPRAVRPPRLPAIEERSAQDLRQQVGYLRRYLRNLGRNEELVHHQSDVRLALDELERIASAPEDGVDIHQRIVDFERERVLPLLDELDTRVDAIIYREALAVGTSTALSPNGTLDVFFVLWRNANLTATIARIYYGRPGLAGSALVLKDVASAILLASVMERISDVSAGLIRKLGEGGRSLPLLGAVVGPAVDGLVNALMTMKLGYLAKERCRSFQAWDGDTQSHAVRRSFRAVGRAGTDLFDDLLRRIDRPLASVKRTADTGKETVHDLSSRTMDFLKGLRSTLRKGESAD